MTGQISDRVLGLNGPNVTLCFVRAVHAYIGLYTVFGNDCTIVTQDGRQRNSRPRLRYFRDKVV